MLLKAQWFCNEKAVEGSKVECYENQKVKVHFLPLFTKTIWNSEEQWGEDHWTSPHAGAMIRLLISI